MEAVVFYDNAKPPFKLVILIKNDYLKKGAMYKHYMAPLKKLGLVDKDVLCLSLKYVNGKALKKSTMEWIDNNLVPTLIKSGTKTVAVADSKYFEYLTGNKSSSYIKSFCNSNIKGLEHINCVPLINYKAITHNASMQTKMKLSLSSIPDALTMLPSSLGARLVKYQYYPNTLADIEDALDKLLNHPALSVDIEAFALDHTEAGIGTISFSTDQDTCVAFRVQYERIGERSKGILIYELLVDFFLCYKGKLILHGGQYDIKVLVYELFMKDGRDYEGLAQGLKCFDNIEDTMLMTYVCTNNTVQNVLNLKDNTMEFAGNYAIDIKDITIHEPPVVLEYNGRDTCNTMYLYNKFKAKIIREKLSLAYKVLKDFILVGVQLEICGFPMSMDHSKDLEQTIRREITSIGDNINNHSCVKDYLTKTRADQLFQLNLESKTKIYNIRTYPFEEFNPNSDTQVADLIHNYLQVAIEDTTKTGLPSMTTDSLIAIKHKLKDKLVIEIVDQLIRLKEITTNYSNFILKFTTKTKQKNGEGAYYLHGAVKLGTTVSGRPTGGGDVNMLALPSTGSVLAKPVKQCFRAEKGRLLVGSDYAGLEDFCASVVTKDTNMLRGKILGIDGHSERAVAYFPEELPEHVKKLEEAEQASKYYIDDSKTGLDKFICK
jgi:DNA polymerase-1